MNILNKINWKIRFMNKAWVLSFVVALCVLAEAVAALFGMTVDLTQVQEGVYRVIEAIFGVIILLGVSIDGTTEGIGDSERALGYTRLGINENEFDDDVADDSDGTIDEEE